MIKFVPVGDADVWQTVAYMEGKWAESSHSENGIWNFDMDHASQFIVNVIAATPGPHGMVAVKRGVVVGVLIGAMVPTWAESENLTFQTMLYNADEGCGLGLMKEVEKTLPKGTRFMLSIQMKTAEKFERVADRLGFVEMDRVFVKCIGEERGGD